MNLNLSQISLNSYLLLLIDGLCLAFAALPSLTPGQKLNMGKKLYYDLATSTPVLVPCDIGLIQPR